MNRIVGGVRLEHLADRELQSMGNAAPGEDHRNRERTRTAMRILSLRTLRLVVSPTALGLGLCLLWMYTLFFNASVYLNADNPAQLRGSVLTVSYLLIAVLRLVSAVFPHRIDGILASRAAPAGIAAATTTGTLFCALAAFNGAISVPVLWIGILLVAVGSTLLVTEWGRVFATHGSEQIGAETLSAHMLATLLFPLSLLLNPVLVVVLMVCCPAGSVALLYLRSKREPPASRTGAATPGKTPLSGVIKFSVGGGIFVLLLTAAPSSLFSSTASIGGSFVFGIVWWLAAACSLAIVALSSQLARRFRVGYVYRSVVVTLIFGYVVSLFGGIAAENLAAVIAVGYLCFQIILWAALANYAGDSEASPITVFGFGTGVYQIFALLGALLLGGISSIPGAPAVDMTAYLVLSISAYVLVYMFLLPERDVLALTDHADVPHGHASLELVCQEFGKGHGLSQRQIEVLTLAARGHNQIRIQQELFLAPGTVNTHMYNIYRKLNIHSHQELIALVEREKARVDAEGE